MKRAILTSLGVIIDKGGVLLRPFLPQLQPTFVKSLNDPNKARYFAVAAVPLRPGVLPTVMPSSALFRSLFYFNLNTTPCFPANPSH